MARPAAPVALLVASVLSGAAGLVYQVLWARELALALGSTTGAVATVLGSFMAGLGLGAALASRALAGRRPSRWAYPGLEAAIALLAVALPPLLRASGGWLAPLQESASPALIAVARVIVAGGLLVVPTALMGATLPVLGARSSEQARSAGRVAGGLYAANTLGAVAGSLAAPLLLLPTLGMTRSSLLAAGLNLAAAAIAGLARPSVGDRPGAGTAPVVPPSLPTPHPTGVALAVAALSGLGALAHEVAWTRSLTLLIGPTVYSFAFILAAVVAGIALGSAAAARIADRLGSPVGALAAVQAAAAAASLLVSGAVGALPLPVAEMVRANAGRTGRLLTLELAGVFAVLLPPCLLFGATFPLAVSALVRGGTGTGPALGRVYAWNTAGAVAGSLLAGFLALPSLGLRETLLAAAATHGLAGALAASRSGAIGLALVSAVLAMAGPLVLPTWDRDLMAGGVYRRAATVGSGPLAEELRAGELLSYREGRGATVTVKRLGRTLSLAVDGRVEASSGGDMLTQRMLAHIPLLLHPAPAAACIVGLGSGATAAAALTHPLASLDVVEISPEVVAASALFRPFNQGALADPRVRLLVADGRHHLRFSPRRYDVIASEPSNPWMPGAAALFTREAFLDARRRLAPGGLFAQWLQLYGLEPADLRRLVGGFTDVFPGAALFLLSEGDALLLGPEGAWTPPSADELLHRLGRSGVREDLATVKVTRPFVFASLHFLDGPALAAWAAGIDRHTDDRPLLERGAARSLLAATGAANHAALLEAAAGRARAEPWASLAASAGAEDLLARAAMLEEAASPEWAFATYLELVRRAPHLRRAGEGLVRTALRIDAVAVAEAELRGAARGEAEIEVRAALATLLGASGRDGEALSELQRCLDLDSRHVGALTQAAALQERLGHPDVAYLLAARAATLAPDDPEAGTLVGSALRGLGHADGARAQADRVLSRHPDYPAALALAALTRTDAGEVDEARHLLGRFVEADPEDWAAFNLLGRLELGAGRAREAAEAFERGVELSFENRDGWQGLLEAAGALGDRTLARRAERALARLRESS